MIDTARCPDPSVLDDLLAGRLDEQQEDRLGEHLDLCTACRRILDEANEQQWFPVETLRDSAGGLDTAESELVQAVKEMISSVPHVERTEAMPATHEASSLDFLAPSDDPEHLGRLGPYEIVEVIGRGAMGVVLKGQDPKLNRVVAIKVLAPELAANATARRRFLREAQAAAAVSHDHVVTIHAVDEAERLPYLVMEYVDGRSLQQRIDAGGPLEVREILRIGMQMASGLAAAHAQGLIHRDIKPSNIMLENGVERVKITDFGLARAIDDVGMTRTGEVAGTPQYMSPEQATGQPMDCRSDLFSLGSVLYAMCTGRSPFRAECTVGVLRRVADDDPRPIRQVNSDVPDWLAVIVEQLFAKDPSHRFQEAGEVADLLGRHLAHLQHPSLVAAPPPLKRSRRSPAGAKRTRAGGKRSAKRRWLLGGLLLVALAGLGLTEATGVTNLAATVIRIATGEGTLVVEVDDPSVDVAIDGEELVVSGAGLHELRLRPGEHQVVARRDGQRVFSELASITRGGREVVKVTLDRSSSSRRADDGRIGLRAASTVPELELVRRLKGHQARIIDVAFSADGSRCVSASEDRKLMVWDGGSAELLDTICVDTPLIRSFALSPDGRRAAVGNHHGTVHLIDLASKEEIHHFAVDPGRVRQVGFLPDGKSLIAGSYNPERDGGAPREQPQSLGHWKLETGERLHPFDEIDYPIQDIAVSPDGRFLLTAGHRRKGHLYEIESGEEIWQLADHRSEVDAVAISPDGRYGASGSEDGSIRLWNLETGDQVQRFDGHQGNVRSLAFTPGGRHLVSGGEDKSLRVWNVASGKEICRVVGQTYLANSVAVSPDGRHVLSGGGWTWRDGEGFVPDGDYALRVWRLPESVWPGPDPENQVTEVRRFGGHTSGVYGVRFLPGAKRAASVSQDGTLRIWDVATGQEVRRFVREPAELRRGLSISPDGRYAAAGGFTGVAYLFDLKTGKELRRLEPEGEQVEATCFSPDGRYLVTGTFDRDVQLWNVSTGEKVRRFEGHGPGRIYETAFSQDGKRLLTVGGRGDKTARIWDVETGREIQRFVGHTDGIQSGAFSPDENLVATGSYDSTVRLWDVETGREVRVFRGHKHRVKTVRFLPDGRHVVSAAQDKTLRVWKVSDGQEVSRLETPHYSTAHFAVSPDGSHLLTGGGYIWDGQQRGTRTDGDYALRLWRLPESVWPEAESEEQAYDSMPTIPEVRRFEGHRDAIQALAVSPDGRLALSGGGENWSEEYGLLEGTDFALRLWQIETGEELRQFTGHTSIVRCVAFSPDGARVLSGGDDLTLPQWDVETGEELDRWGSGSIRGVSFSPDGRRAVSCNPATLLDVDKGSEIRRFGPFEGWLWCVAFSPHGRQTVFGGEGNHDEFPLWLCNVETGKELRKLPGHEKKVGCVAFAEDGSKVVSGGFDGTVRVWDTRTGRQSKCIETPLEWVQSLSLRSNNRHVAVAGTVGVWIHDLETGKAVCRLDGPTGGSRAVAFTPDGRSVLSGGLDKALHVWRLPETVWPEGGAGDADAGHGDEGPAAKNAGENTVAPETVEPPKPPPSEESPDSESVDHSSASEHVTEEQRTTSRH